MDKNDIIEGKKRRKKSSNKTNYTQEFKQAIVNLYQASKTYNNTHKEYGVSHSALDSWTKTYSEVKIDDNTVLTVRQIKEIQNRNTQLDEENLILKKLLRYSCPSQTKLNSIKLLSSEHSFSMLCCVLKVNRSTYYKFLSNKPSEFENREI